MTSTTRSAIGRRPTRRLRRHRCDNCQRRLSTRRVRFPDGETFDVCARCCVEASTTEAQIEPHQLRVQL